jgi:protein phosphatase
VLAVLANGRLKRRLTTVVDATNLRAANRKRYRQLAARYGVPVVCVAFDYSPETYRELNRRRSDRNVEEEVVDGQASRMRDAMASVLVEDYAALYVFRDPATAEAASITR